MIYKTLHRKQKIE